ncbi:hypothetical protein BMW24_008695 [Mycobacterium heckeshornense]|nr:hypothetical protein ACT16_22950 [Mycobacterium heckeshornense]PIJ35831.1 hypothetical protein BMW24_008695 [Mycobacterium heckeshornense]
MAAGAHELVERHTAKRLDPAQLGDGVVGQFREPRVDFVARLAECREGAAGGCQDRLRVGAAQPLRAQLVEEQPVQLGAVGPGEDRIA